MTRAWLAFGIVVMVAACSHHYVRVEGDTLSLFLEKADAKKVIFACSLDGFEPHEARNADGRWIVSVPRGSQFRYYYVVDGSYYPTSCELKEDDDFGSKNCIYDPHM